jgi:hypothetical protein
MQQYVNNIIQSTLKNNADNFFIFVYCRALTKKRKDQGNDNVNEIISLSAYEETRLATIEKNNLLLDLLGLGTDRIQQTSETPRPAL